MSPPIADSEAGFGLPSVLLLITLLSLLVGSVLVVDLAGRQASVQRSDRLQARYAAEAALDLAYAEATPDQPTDSFEVPLGPRIRSRATLEPFGVFLLVNASGQTGRARSQVRSLIGAPPGEATRYALVLGDPSTPLVLAGDAVVEGTILTGPAGIQYGDLPRRPNAPRHDGAAETTTTARPITLPVASATQQRLEAVLHGATPSSDGDSALVLSSFGDLTIRARDLPRSDSRDLWIVAGGDVDIVGPLTLPPYVRIAAGGEVRLTGPIAGGPALAYGRQSATTRGAVTASLHLLAGRSVRVGPGAALRYPSSAVALGVVDAEVEIGDGSTLDGVAAYAPDGPGRGTVAVSPRAHVRGGVYSADRADIQGTITGPTVVWQLRFYDSPATYVNWLRSGRFDARSLPPRAVPFGVAAPGTAVALTADRRSLPDDPQSERSRGRLYSDRGRGLPRASRHRAPPARRRVLVVRRPRRRSGPDGRPRARTIHHRRGSVHGRLSALLSCARALRTERRLDHLDGDHDTRSSSHYARPRVEGATRRGAYRALPQCPPRYPTPRRPLGSPAAQSDAGFSLVELSVGASLTLLTVSIAVAIVVTLSQQAATWRDNTELASTAATTLEMVSADLMVSTELPLTHLGGTRLHIATPDDSARTVEYHLSDGVLLREGRKVNGPGVSIEGLRFAPRGSFCTDVALTVASVRTRSRRLTVGTTACIRASTASLGPSHP
ncbi:PilW family protein [Rubricoccus marinus]|uniref:Uncharacterized protein n=1 Tax=Rubricoccus marinus TaxID=716817 RepID=A0A259TU93_9BACT|nr:hypothetical protein [Rubricoccus marinus]OZC01270.1 hypothetical protein BSZ36_17640 [Rubricoccus marinus]